MSKHPDSLRLASYNLHKCRGMTGPYAPERNLKVIAEMGADVIALTASKIITVKGEALLQASETCRMHFYQGFLEVLAARLALANARLASA